jgi:hypothetical protein
VQAPVLDESLAWHPRHDHSDGDLGPGGGKAEYHNAGGWPTRGFSQSSGIHDVWNYWIIYPAIAWVLLTAGDAWWTFGRKPVSEAEIKHEMDRQAGQR